MIRTNLATRPFYNERVVYLAILLIAVLAVAATVFNVTRVAQLSRRDTRLATQASRDENAAADLRQRAGRLRQSVDAKLLETASADAHQANDLIDRRTFSWTELSNRLEMTQPDDVRLAAVRPKLDPKKGIIVTIIVGAKGVDDVNQFIANLDSSGAFAELEKKDEAIDEDKKQLIATLEGVYKPGAAPRAQAGND